VGQSLNAVFFWGHIFALCADIYLGQSVSRVHKGPSVAMMHNVNQLMLHISMLCCELSKLPICFRRSFTLK
jgi:hypothetical protein